MKNHFGEQGTAFEEIKCIHMYRCHCKPLNPQNTWIFTQDHKIYKILKVHPFGCVKLMHEEMLSQILDFLTVKTEKKTQKWGFLKKV